MNRGSRRLTIIGGLGGANKKVLKYAQALPGQANWAWLGDSWKLTGTKRPFRHLMLHDMNAKTSHRRGNHFHTKDIQF